MADHNFIRYFIILNEKQKKYTNTDRQPLSGYCKVESLNNRAVLTLSIRNMASLQNGYGFYVILKEANEPVRVGDVYPQKDGALFTSFETRADALFDTDKSITTLDAVFLCDNTNGTVVLMGYSNKRAQMNDNSDIMLKAASVALKIQNEINSEINGDTEDLSAKTEDGNECICSECAFSDTVEDTVDESEVEEVVKTPIDIIAQKLKNIVDDNADNSQSPYAKILAGMYKSMISGSKDKNDDCEDAEPMRYWDSVKDHYCEMFATYKNVDPFYKHSDNTKWILIKNEGECFGGDNLVGLVYEGGEVKYIVNGTPVYSLGMCMYAPVRGSFWMPTKREDDFRNILGYWLTIIDASNGSVVMPFVKF